MNKPLASLTAIMLVALAVGGCGRGRPTTAPATEHAPEAPIATVAPTESLPPASADDTARDVEGWAVLVSKEDYSDTGRPVTSNLTTGFLDLYRLRSVLSYYGWREDHILEIRDDVTEDTVVQSLEWLAQNADNDDVVFFYIEGHGGFLERELRWETFFPDHWREIPSDRRVLVVSACGASRFTRAVRADHRPQVSIASIREDELGWAGVWYEGLPIIGHVFNHYFAQAFTDTRADLDGDWAVSVQEAARFAEEHQRQYMHEVVYAIPAYAWPEEQVVDAESPHVVVEDTVGEPVLLDLTAYSHLPALQARRSWSGIEPRVVEGYYQYRSLSMAPNGGALAYVGAHNAVHILGLPDLAEVARFGASPEEIRRLDWSGDSARLAVLGVDWLQVWPVGAHQPSTSVDFAGMDLWSVSWSSDGTRLALGSSPASVLILDTTTWAQIQTVEGHPSEDVAWSPAGNMLAGGGEDGVWVWDLASGQNTLAEECAAVDVAWSTEGTRLAASCEGIIYIWDAASGDEIVQLDHWAGVEAMAWSPDSTLLAAGTTDGFTKIWDIATGEVIGSMRDYVGRVDGVAWSADGEILASAGDQDGLLLIWEVP